MTDNKIIPVSKVKTIIDSLVEQGFMPSWNNDTNSTHLAVTGHPTPSQEELGVCSKCGAPNKLSAKGKPYCSKKCWL